TTGPGQSFPVGLESFVQLFEPWMLRELELDHYDKERAFIQPRAARFNDPNPATNVTNARNQAKAQPAPGPFSAREGRLRGRGRSSRQSCPGYRRVSEVFRH